MLNSNKESVILSRADHSLTVTSDVKEPAVLTPGKDSKKEAPMRRNIITATLYTIVTTIIFGLIYPFVVTGIAQIIFKDKANGQLIQQTANSSAHASSAKPSPAQPTSTRAHLLQETVTTPPTPAAPTTPQPTRN